MSFTTLRRALIVLLSALMIQTATTGTAMAATVILGGANGLNGADGADGVPGETGGDGGAAPAIVTAIAVDTFQRNIAEATGGNGGPGGDGGDATPGSGANGGNGGAGGMGGDAVAIATTLGLDMVRAVATGGAVGAAGQGGDGSAPGVDGMRGTNLGVTSGSATATATIDRASAIIGQFSEIQGDAIAVGTNATATVIGEVIGNPNDLTAVHRLEANANGGAGHAIANASGMANHGTLNVIATAEGAFGRDDARQVTATASGVHTGSGVLNVTANTRLFSLSFAGPGIANPSASGIATNGAVVNVLASAIGGSDRIDLRDAVSGSTSGRLTLSQLALKSSRRLGATTPFSGEGEIRTRLIAENLGGGDLEINIDAQNERLPFDLVGGGDIILGDVRGVSNVGANVDIDVFVRGFRVIRQQLDSAGSPSHIEGISTGGDVSVAGDFRSGNGLLGVTIVGSNLVAGSAPSIEVVNAVRGQTSGQLSLQQDVDAADGGDVPLLGPSSPGASADAFFAGDGGDAVSQLSQSGSFQSLEMSARSTSGSGGNATRMGIGGDSGSATTIIEGENDAGGVILAGSAESFRGGTSEARTGYGGDATVDLQATTYGDGHSILIGNERPSVRVSLPSGGFQTLEFGAEGGDGGRAANFRFSMVPEEFGQGGIGESRADGLAYGDSEVLVYSHASGGYSSGGDGGHATSTARAEGGGPSRVLAQSVARGGGGFEGAGDARAIAQAIGFGDVQARSLSFAGSSTVGRIGTTTARSIVEIRGDSGTATTVAEMPVVVGAGIRASVHRAMTSASRFEVTVGDALEVPVPALTNAGSAFLTRNPLAADAAQFVQGHSAFDSLLETVPGARVEALGQWSARGVGAGPTTQLVELDITLSTPEDQADLALAISAQESIGGGFELLRFRLEVLGEVFGEEVSFTDLSEATIYFSSVFNLGQAYREFVPSFGDPAVRAIFEVTIGAGQSVSYGLAAVVVPEPSAALMIGLGLLFFVSTKSRAAFTS